MTGPGTTLGGYRIERPLGRGGMGAVFLAYDTTLRRFVALKVMGQGADSASSRAHLLREARSAAALNHPHICTIHEVGDAGGTAFIAMEYVEGRSLRDRIDEAGRLPQDELLRYGIQAADALAYAHDHGVVHRDLKAANAMITTGGRLKVVDFGLARRTDPSIHDASTLATIVPPGAAAGTPYAMAPEQVRGEPADARTDVWALGVLLFEMATGTKPFDAPTANELFSAVLKDAPRPWPSHAPMAIRPAIERCLEKDPARRFQSAREVQLVLETIQSGLVPAWTTWRYRLPRAGWLTAAGALLAISVIGTLLTVGGLRGRFSIPAAPAALIKLAVLPFENLTGDARQEFFSDGLTEETISQLGRLHPQRLSVIARTSTMAYKTRTASIADVGRELGVEYVLEGSARREGQRVRISVTLIRVSDQTQLWSDGFDRELTSVLTLQNDVARGVAGALALALLPKEQARLAQARAVNPEAYDAYLLGSSHVDRLARTDLDVAQQYFEQALEKDPSYALAHVGIYRVWATRQQLVPALRRAADAPRRAALAKAVALDDQLPEVQAALAGQAVTDWDWAAADERFRRAIDLNPSFATARAFYSQYLAQMKRPGEAMVQIERAIALDPLNPSVQTLYGLALNNANRPAEAVQQFENVLRTTPQSGVALTGLQGALTRLGRPDEAIAIQRRRAGARGDDELDAALGRGTAAGGDQAWREAISTLEGRARAGEYVNEIEIALFYLRLKEPERAIDWLERAFESHSPNLPGISNRRPFEPLRDHPRFQALVKRMNLPI